MEEYFEIIEKLERKRFPTAKDLDSFKKEVAKKFRLVLPTNADLLKLYHKTGRREEKILSLLRTRPVRSLSGVVNISLLTNPFSCPGKCIYCPSEKEMPKSYLKNEPAATRAFNNNFHPQKQIKARIKALQEMGHPVEKIELRIVGGTWSFYPLKYRMWFIKNCFDACNKEKSRSLTEAKKKNEDALHRLVCVSIETRPDFINKKEIRTLRIMGVTMVELGVQSLSDEVLNFSQRGHGRKEIVFATKILKDAGFKICYQVMLNLPLSSPEDDINTFREIFENSDFRPDFLKIYPCLVIKGTPLYKLFKEKKYQPFEEDELVDIIAKIKKDIIPPYARIQRLFRDISAGNISGGCKRSNLREIIDQKARKEGWKCKCIRCREVKESYNSVEKNFLFIKKYKASKGSEFFLSIENKNKEKLYAFLRLRESSECLFPSLKEAAIIRELRTYGRPLSIKNKKSKSFSPQHRGIGKKLIKKAEKIAKEELKSKRIAVIAAVGTRNYWRKRGYKLKGTYMVKDLY